MAPSFATPAAEAAKKPGNSPNRVNRSNASYPSGKN